MMMKAHTFQWPQELEGYSTKILAHNNKMCDHVRERACSQRLRHEKTAYEGRKEKQPSK